MADWTNITDSQVDPDAPLTSEIAYAWRDNPIAIAEGAVGAPRISFPAMGSWYSSGADVGSIAFLQNRSGAITTMGDTTAGSNLRYSSAGGTATGTGPSGTWKCLGLANVSTSATPAATTLWIRIA